MDFTAIYGLWLRDMKRFMRIKTQFLSSLVRPILWLVIMGGGLRPIVQNVDGVDYMHFIFAGVISITIIFAAMQSAISIVWDREFGFLKEVLVAPIPRLSVVIGKALGGSTIATIQGSLTLLFLPLIGLSISVWTLLLLLGAMFLLSFAISSLGIVIAGRMTTFEGFGTISNFLLMPMFFLSGAIYPITSVPEWLKALLYLNPLTYGVDLMRGILIDFSQFSALWNLSILIGFIVLMMSLAVPLFRRE